MKRKKKKKPPPEIIKFITMFLLSLLKTSTPGTSNNQHCLASPHSSLQLQSLENSDREIKQLVQSNTAGDEGDGSEGQAQHLVAVRYIITENTYLSCSFHCTLFMVLLSSPPFPLLLQKTSLTHHLKVSQASVLTFHPPRNTDLPYISGKETSSKRFAQVTERQSGRVVIKLSYI